MVGNSTWKDYLRKTLLWFFGNVVFGLAPLIFMCGVYVIGQQNVGRSEIDIFIHEGVVLFVLAAIMGSILLDYALGGYSFNAFQVFTIFFVPCGIIGILCLNYLFIKLKIITEERFDLSSYTSILVMSLSLVYCIIAKTNLYIREDTKGQKS